jgi:YbbR domain-containing protein
MAKRDYIFHNFWWKITSFLLAIIVWIVVHGTDRPGDVVPRAKRRFPRHALSLMRDSTDKRPIRISPNEVEIVVSAPIMEATRLSDADIQTFVDLGDVSGRHDKVRIRVFVPASRGVRLESVVPEEATVDIDDEKPNLK